MAQRNKNCQEFREGYYMLDRRFSQFLIKREKDRQVEIDQYGSVLIFDINWTDECTYMLTLRSTDNMGNHPVEMEFAEGELISVSIMKPTQSGYELLKSTNYDPRNIYTEIIKLDKEDFMNKLELIGYADDDF